MTDGSYIRESFKTVEALGSLPEGSPEPDVLSVVPGRQKTTLGRLARPMPLSSLINLGLVAWSMLVFFSGPHPGSRSVYNSAP